MEKLYRRTPTFTYAVKYDGANTTEIMKFCGFHLVDCGHYLRVPAHDGEYELEVGDYLVKGSHGEFYPVRAGIFEKCYEEVVVNELDV